MKYAVMTFLAICFSLFAAEEAKEPKGPQAPRYEHFSDQDGKIYFTVDHKDNSIEYKENAKEAVKLLLGMRVNIINECNKVISELQKPSKKSEVKAKKVESKKDGKPS